MNKYVVMNKKGEGMRFVHTEEEAKAIVEKKSKWGWTYRKLQEFTTVKSIADEYLHREY